MRAVYRSEPWTVLKAGTHLLSFYDSDKPYVETPEDDVDWLAKVSQERAWRAHKAFTYIQYANPTTDVELANCVLARVLVHLLDENCVGIYSPSENSLIPADDESLLHSWKQMAGFRDSGIISNP